MRVVYLADAPYIHTRRWVQHFARLGWDAHVISFRPAKIDGATVHYVDGFETIGKARYVVHARRVRSLIEALKPDLLHALHLTSYGFLAGRMRRLEHHPSRRPSSERRPHERHERGGESHRDSHPS